MGEFKAAAQLLGVTADTSTAAALQASLHALRAACQDEASREVGGVQHNTQAHRRSVVFCICDCCSANISTVWLS